MERQDHVTLVLGKRRSGKSTLLRGDDPLDEGIVDWTPYERVYVLDPRREWADGLRFQSITGTSGLQAALQADAKRSLDQRYARRKKWIIQVGHPQKIENFFRLVAPNQRTGKKGVPGLFVLDEASEYQSSHSMDDGLRRMVQLGGNDAQSVILAARFWKQLHREIRQNRDLVLAFRGIHADTVKEWKRSFDAGAPVVHKLQEHQFTMLGEHRAVQWASRAQNLDSYVSSTDEH